MFCSTLNMISLIIIIVFVQNSFDISIKTRDLPRINAELPITDVLKIIDHKLNDY